VHAASKPVVIALMGERLIQEAVEHFRAAHIPEYRFPERAASALTVLAQRAEYLRRRDDPIPTPSGIDRQRARQVFISYLETQPQLDWLPASIAETLMTCYGIQVPPAFLAETPEEAAEMAVKAKFPVVLKVASPDIPHKSDVDGVLVDLWDASAAAQGFNQVVERARLAVPQAHIHGAVIQHMLPPGQDVIIGALQDPQFGAVLMFGSGGVEAEGLKDVSFTLAPLSQEESSFLLETTWAGRKLAGYRSLPPADRAAVIDVLLRFSHLAADFPELSEIEINPLRVLAEGQGAYALDLRARLAPNLQLAG
jgi:acetyltransferase